MDKSWMSAVFGVLATGLVGITLAHVGWSGELPTIDRLGQIYDALAFLDTGRIPQTANVTSYGFVIPPGTTWIILPGVALFDDPGLFGLPGFAVLYLATLVGIYLLARQFARPAGALFAVSLFALSAVGIFFAHSGSGYGHPFFVVWVAYFAWRWVADRRPAFLAAALFVWGLGMYVLPVIAPVIFVFPILWWIHRPPVRFGPLMIAALVLSVVWFPYLRFDYAQDFKNILSQITLTSPFPEDFERSWNDPSLRKVLETRTGGVSLSGSARAPEAVGLNGAVKGLGIWVARKLSNLSVAVTANLDLGFDFSIRDDPRAVLAQVPGYVFGLVVMGLALSGLLGPRPGHPSPEELIVRSRFGRLVDALGVGAIVVAILANEFFLARYVSIDGHLWLEEIIIVRHFQGMMLVTGLAVLWRRRLRVWLASLAARFEGADDQKTREFIRVLAIFLLVPMLFLVVLAKPGAARRFLFLWPFQCLFMAMFFTQVLPGAHAVRRAWSVLVLAMFVYAPAVKAMSVWTAAGYRGDGNPFSKVMSSISDILHAEGKTSAAISYHISFSGYHAAFNIMDDRYKVGAVGDFLLWYGHRIVNETKAAEGARPGDEFLIVQSPPASKNMMFYIPPPAEGYRTIATVADYRVLRKTP